MAVSVDVCWEIGTMVNAALCSFGLYQLIQHWSVLHSFKYSLLTLLYYLTQLILKKNYFSATPNRLWNPIKLRLFFFFLNLCIPSVRHSFLFWEIIQCFILLILQCKINYTFCFQNIKAGVSAIQYEEDIA